jgi:sugar fermentation stimulation protein A
MQFASELVEGLLLRRYQRFLADVRLADGTVVVAHCPNTGSMKTCLEPGTRAWLSRARPGRKLAYTWEVAEQDDARIYVNPAGANALVAEAIARGGVLELAGYTNLLREVRYGASSRIDLLLQRESEHCYVEVKNATLRMAPGCIAFPDAITARGTKHLHELMDMVRQGHRAVVFFCVGRTDAQIFRPAITIDPLYCATLAQAIRSGVEVLAYGVEIDRRHVVLARRLPVQFPD